MKKKILFLGLLFTVMHGYSQEIREFSLDDQEFIVQFSMFMGNLEKEELEVLARFEDHWVTGVLTPEEKNEIIEVSNHMLKRRARPKPHFLTYLKLLEKRKSPVAENINLSEWFTSYHALIAGTSVNFNLIQRNMAIALSLTEESVLYDLAGTRWEASNADFRFSTEGGLPVAVFSGIDLSCIANKDTMYIYNTSGRYDLINLTWEGKEGMVTWERAGYLNSEVYARLKTYQIEFKKAFYQADSVEFFYSKYFDFPLTGYLQDRAKPYARPSQATFPKFYSYQSSYFIPELFRGISYLGSMSMQGAKLVGTGTVENPARLSVLQNDTLRMIIRSQNIIIGKSEMSSSSAAITLKIDADSIFHPDVGFLFLEATDELTFSRRDVYTSGVPYINSYHNLNMNFEELSWKRGSGEVRMKPSIGRAVGAATFESDHFFNYSFFSELQGRDYEHPLVSLWNFSRQLNGADMFPLSAYAGIIGKPEYLVKHMMMKLSRLGFIYYDDQKDLIRLNDKLFYFIEASIGQIDYDIIYLQSNVHFPQENAVLNLSSRDLAINGIQIVSLSDSQNVRIYPAGEKIIMKKNKSFAFNGRIEAGLFNLYGQDFCFNYDRFKIDLVQVDSLKVRMISVNKFSGLKEVVDIQNLIQNLKGEIVIDEPDNKSGRESNTEYPILKSTDYSYVYFDSKDIEGGVYKRDKVFFRLDTFEIESIDDFKREEVELLGFFESSGIFPPLQQKLTLREDNSLGFMYSAPEEGLPVYEGKGVFYEDFEMGKNGLRGSGKLEYLTSTTYSDNFLFHPDSLMTDSKEFSIERDIGLIRNPQVQSKNSTIKWLTEEEKMFAEMQDVPFNMFSDTVRLKGGLLLEPDGLSGSGTMDLVTADIRSGKFDFTQDKIMSDTAEFRLKSPENKEITLKASNVNTDINFISGTGTFISNEPVTKVEFPQIKYESELSFLEWGLNKETVKLRSDNANSFMGDDGLSGTRYYSLVPGQDSLNFVAPVALYNNRSSTLEAMEVPYIQIADARIVPYEGKIEIDKKSRIGQLSKATIITDYRTERFRLRNADVSITGKNDYTASADYDYTDMTDAIQTIHFKQIRVDEKGQTTADTKILPEDHFTLSPYFEFHGEVSLKSTRENLNFKGGARLIHTCGLGKHWLKFEAEIDPMNVVIPVTEPLRTVTNAPSFAGTFISRDSTHIYSAFLSRRKDYFDGFIVTANGYLQFDPTSGRYEIASEEKLGNKELSGNILALDKDACRVYGEGKLDLQLDYGQIKMNTVGNTEHNTGGNSFQANLMMAFDFLFSTEAMDIFANDLDSIPGVQAMDIRNDFYIKSLRELLGKTVADKMQADLSLFAEYRNIPQGLQKMLILSGINLKWNPQSRSYRHEGSVDIIRAGNQMINRKVEMVLEFTKRRSGDLMDMYFRLNDDSWYYFGYNPGSMQVVSSNRRFNQLIMDIRENERKVKGKPGDTGYIYTVAPNRRVQLFLRRFNSVSRQE